MTMGRHRDLPALQGDLAGDLGAFARRSVPDASSRRTMRDRIEDVMIVAERGFYLGDEVLLSPANRTFTGYVAGRFATDKKQRLWYFWPPQVMTKPWGSEAVPDDA